MWPPQSASVPSVPVGRVRAQQPQQPQPQRQQQQQQQQQQHAWQQQQQQSRSQYATAAASAPNNSRPASQKAQGGTFPEGLKEWVQRHFEACNGDASKSQVDSRIRSFLGELGNAIWQRNWNSEPLLVPIAGVSAVNKPAERDSDGRIVNPWRKKVSRSRSPSIQNESNNGEDFGNDYDKSGRHWNRDGGRNKNKKKRTNDYNNKRGSKKGNNRNKRRGVISMSDDDVAKKKAERAARFERSASSVRPTAASSTTSWSRNNYGSSAVDNTLHAIEVLRNVAQRGGAVDWDSVVIKGTCTDIRKDYYRMNDMIPDPETVRPQSVLQEAVLDLVAQRDACRGDRVKSRELYRPFLFSQWKAIRQDLQVQHIRNNFTLEVCERNVKLCMEEEDMPEMNTCQVLLFDLYGTQGSVNWQASNEQAPTTAS